MWFLVEFFCEACGQTVESLERRSEVPASKPCECGATSVLCVSAPKIGTVWGAAVSTGKSDERPPGVVDTSVLADGTKWSEWKARRAKERVERRWAANRAAIA